MATCIRDIAMIAQEMKGYKPAAFQKYRLDS